MKKYMILAIAVCLCLPACAVHVRRPRRLPVVVKPVIVTEAAEPQASGAIVEAEVALSVAPPPPPTTVVVKAGRPGPDHVWVAGHHVVRSGRYLWVKGCWKAPPRRGAHYVPGHWKRSPRGGVWVRGHWR